MEWKRRFEVPACSREPRELISIASFGGTYILFGPRL